MRLPSSLRARITLLVVIPLAVQLALLGRLTYIQHEAEVALKNADQYSKVVVALNKLNLQTFSVAETFYNTRMDFQNAEEIIDQVQKTVAGFNSTIEEVRAVVNNDPAATEDLDAFVKNKDDLIQLVRGFARSFMKGEGKEGRKELNKKFVQKLRDSAGIIADLEATMHEMANERMRRSMRIRAEEPLLLGAFGVVTALLGVVAMFSLSHDASQKLDNLRRNVANLASGADLQPPAVGKDEIALIDKTFFETATSLRRAQANQRELVSMFTHDMRNPLTSMALALDTLAEKPDLEPHQKKIDSLRNNTRRLSELIADLLDLYKSETGMMTFASEAVPASEICTDALNAIVDAAQALSVEIAAPAKLEGIAMLGDRKATARILTNLLSNAVKHSPANSRVELSVLDNIATNTIDFAVIDHGSGIPQSERASIFNRFQQGSTAQHSRLPGLGTGLGLAICKTFAQRQGGDVELTASTVGGGSTFTLRLPRAQG